MVEKRIKKLKNINKKKEKRIVEALKKSLLKSISEDDKSDLEKDLEIKSNIDNDFVESVRTESVTPILRSERRVERENLEDNLSVGERRDETGDVEQVNYTLTDRTGYIGEEYIANARRERQMLAEERVKKVQTRRAVNPDDMMVNDPRIMKNPLRPRLMERNEDQIGIEVTRYEDYESKLPFQKREKKYKTKI